MPELEILWREPRVRQPIVGPLSGQAFEKRFEGVAYSTGLVLCQTSDEGGCAEPTPPAPVLVVTR